MRSLSRSRGMCEWDDFAGSAARVRHLLAEDRAGRISPFLLLSVPGISAREQRGCSELWIRDRVAASSTDRDRLAFQFDLTPRGKLRIGYFSNDFHDHATSQLLIETFEAHDRARCEVHAFSFGADDGGTMRRRLGNAFHAFHDVAVLSDIETARAVHGAGIDILVDLKGYTLGARTGVMMLRPAPVQVNFLGYPGTLGAGICDYIITDPFVTPMAAASDYSEAFAYMPHCYQPQPGGTGSAPGPDRTNHPRQWPFPASQNPHSGPIGSGIARIAQRPDQQLCVQRRCGHDSGLISDRPWLTG